MKASNPMGRVLRRFFYDYLSEQRNFSEHTIAAYRDALKLYLNFVADALQRRVAALEPDDLTAAQVLSFLRHLETDRKVCVKTRNHRLAALHTFHKYLAAVEPRYLDQCQQVLAIPFKRSSVKVVTYLNKQELTDLLRQPDRTTQAGRRDYALLCVMYNTGCRVQEVLNIRVADLYLNEPYTMRLMGKGRKERLCPLWPQTAALLRSFTREIKITQVPTAPVFVNQHGQPLTRFGVRHLLQKYRQRLVDADLTQSTKPLHPHIMRHTAAVHMLQSGMDLNSVRNLLGHVSVNTTTIYAEIDLAMKQAAIEKANTGINETNGAEAPLSDEVIAWLETL